MNTAVDWSLRSFIILVIAAVVAGVLLLFFELLYELLKPVGLSDLANRGQFVQGVLTLFALLAALLTIAVSARVESSEYKAIQQVKIDVVALIAVLLSLVRKVGHSRASGRFRQKVGENEQSFAHLITYEVKELQKFVVSPSAFAISVWIAVTVEKRVRSYEDSAEKAENEAASISLREWRLFMIY